MGEANPRPAGRLRRLDQAIVGKLVEKRHVKGVGERAGEDVIARIARRKIKCRFGVEQFGAKTFDVEHRLRVAEAGAGGRAARAVLPHRFARRTNDLGMSLQAEVAGPREMRDIAGHRRRPSHRAGRASGDHRMNSWSKSPHRLHIGREQSHFRRTKIGTAPAHSIPGVQFLLKPTALATAMGRPNGFLMNFRRHSGQRSKRSC